jgi:hypothetical protein
VAPTAKDHSKKRVSRLPALIDNGTMKRRDLVDLVMLAALWGASFLFTRMAAPGFEWRSPRSCCCRC